MNPLMIQFHERGCKNTVIDVASSKSCVFTKIIVTIITPPILSTILAIEIHWGIQRRGSTVACLLCWGEGGGSPYAMAFPIYLKELSVYVTEL
mmetsp:Transcript_2840/g.5017  ORF Transcript_2840/g.5017 Transcript_2840/m.5017 type:complete len:93 (+) Transcript_2840:601-879(+)